MFVFFVCIFPLSYSPFTRVSPSVPPAPVLTLDPESRGTLEWWPSPPPYIPSLVDFDSKAFLTFLFFFQRKDEPYQSSDHPCMDPPLPLSNLGDSFFVYLTFFSPLATNRFFIYLPSISYGPPHTCRCVAIETAPLRFPLAQRSLANVRCITTCLRYSFLNICLSPGSKDFIPRTFASGTFLCFRETTLSSAAT